jgi:iodotyrosine deiodinase
MTTNCTARRSKSRIVEAGYQGHRSAQDCSNAAYHVMISEFAPHRRRAPKEWLEALRPFRTDENKPYLEIAPWVIAIFLRRFTRLPDGRKLQHYFTDESVGIATGLLIAAVHAADLVSLTHTPNPMGFMNEILHRQKDIERPYMLLVVGYPAKGATVPDINRMTLEQTTTFV